MNKKKVTLEIFNGFTLVELIITLGVFSIIILILYNILSFSIKSGEKIEKENEYIQNGKYAINYITKEIKSCDEIVSSKKFANLDELHPVNLGFVIKKNIKNNKYLYITYYHHYDRIRRCAVESKEEYPSGYLFAGHNNIAEYIYSIENTTVDFDKRTITLDFFIGKDKDEDINLKTIIYIRCPVDN